MLESFDGFLLNFIMPYGGGHVSNSSGSTQLSKERNAIYIEPCRRGENRK
jgi:hypothetical protein